jgi:hypothetical protein
MLDLPVPPADVERPTLVARPRSNGTVELRWSGEAAPPPDDVNLAKETLLLLVSRTTSRFADNHEAQRFVEMARHTVNESARIGPGNIATIQEYIHLGYGARLGRSTSSMEAPRTPTECMASWLDHVEDALSTTTADSPVRARLLELRSRARAAWMAHEMSIDATGDALFHAKKFCSAAKLPGLAAAAQALMDELTRHGEERPPQTDDESASDKLARHGNEGPPQTDDESASGELEDIGGLPPTRLHDNLNGRVWESALVADFLKEPSQGVKDATHRLGRYLASQLDRVPSDSSALHDDLKAALAEVRPWSGAYPEIGSIARAEDLTTALRQLKALLLAQPGSGLDCVALHWLAQQTTCSLCETMPSFFDWFVDADRNYGEHVYPAKSISPQSAEPLNPPIAVGITLAHQPSLQVLGAGSAVRACALRRPHLRDLSGAAKSQLNSGAPYVAGMSGNSNLLFYLMAHARFNAVDLINGFIGTMMALNYDGGHSLHECLWVYDQAASHLWNLEPMFGSGSPDEYVSDYGRFIEQIPDPETQQHFQRSADAAFEALYEYRRTHLGRASFPGVASDVVGGSSST